MNENENTIWPNLCETMKKIIEVNVILKNGEGTLILPT